jgi:hypothetical protein
MVKPGSQSGEIEVKVEKKSREKSEEPREKKYKMVLNVEDRDIINDAKNWIDKVSHYPTFQNWKTRNTPNPTWKPDGRIGQEIAKKLEKILAETT